jgi:oxygen-independent coproporphyrinogen-3 oxidase
LGVQALDDVDLRRLGRMHSAEEALAAVDLAREVFPKVSADLIYARQQQTEQAWRRELGRMLGLGLDHLSLYQLTIEPETVFGMRHRRGLLKGLPSEDLGADLYEATQEVCEAAGLPAYEVSSHARPGEESRHNLVYWRAGDWVGIGPGAVGRVTVADERRSSAAPLAPATWLAAAAGASGATTWRPADGQGGEYVMMGLRLTEGISKSRACRLGAGLPEVALKDMTAEGLLQEKGAHGAATASLVSSSADRTGQAPGRSTAGPAGRCCRWMAARTRARSPTASASIS